MSEAPEEQDGGTKDPDELSDAEREELAQEGRLKQTEQEEEDAAE